MATTKEIRQVIQSAFAGVKLDGGISLDQAKVIDKYGEGVTEQEFKNLPKNENTDDWKAVPDSALEPDPCVAHYDAKGLRYYLPRLILSVLANYDNTSMRVIGTLQALYPEPKFWEYHMKRYSELNNEQKRAIALFVESLPNLVGLDRDDCIMMERALKRYWREYLA